MYVKIGYTCMLKLVIQMYVYVIIDYMYVKNKPDIV
jgi:hypothetical protein